MEDLRRPRSALPGRGTNASAFRPRSSRPTLSRGGNSTESMETTMMERRSTDIVERAVTHVRLEQRHESIALRSKLHSISEQLKLSKIRGDKLQKELNKAQTLVAQHVEAKGHSRLPEYPGGLVSDQIKLEDYYVKLVQGLRDREAELSRRCAQRDREIKMLKSDSRLARVRELVAEVAEYKREVMQLQRSNVQLNDEVNIAYSKAGVVKYQSLTSGSNNEIMWKMRNDLEDADSKARRLEIINAQLTKERDKAVREKNNVLKAHGYGVSGKLSDITSPRKSVTWNAPQSPKRQEHVNSANRQEWEIERRALFDEIETWQSKYRAEKRLGNALQNEIDDLGIELSVKIGELHSLKSEISALKLHATAGIDRIKNNFSAETDAEAAAVRIQAWARGRQARKQYAAMREAKLAHIPLSDDSEVMSEGLNAESATIRIQAVARGKKARREVAELRITSQQLAKEVKATDESPHVEEGEYFSSSTEMAPEEAAVYIQSAYRGWQGRQRVNAMQSQFEGEDAGLSDSTVGIGDPQSSEGRPPVQEGEFSTSSTEMAPEEAAVYIQSAYRGWQGRQRVNAMQSQFEGEDAGLELKRKRLK